MQKIYHKHSKYSRQKILAPRRSASLRPPTGAACRHCFHSQKQNVPGLTFCLCMGACGHSADGQPQLTFEEFPDTFYLLVEAAALRGGEFVEWLHSDVEFSARAAQVPDTGNRPVDEQHREVSGLATGSQRAFGRPAGEE